MSSHADQPRTPSGVSAGGQFSHKERGESPASLAHAAGETGRTLTEYLAHARELIESDDWVDGEVDTDELLTDGLRLLEQTGTHDDLVTRMRAEQDSEAYQDGDADVANMAEKVVVALERHKRVADAVAISPFAGSTGLRTARLTYDGENRPVLTLTHTIYDHFSRTDRPVTARLYPSNVVRWHAGGTPVIGADEAAAHAFIADGSIAPTSTVNEHMSHLLRALR